MPIRNINQIQNDLDYSFEFSEEYDKEYIIQALANLGQRIGIKGNGIEISSFRYRDLLNDNSIDSSKYIGLLYYDKKDNEPKANFMLYDIDTKNVQPISNETIIYNIYNYLKLDQSFYFSKVFNNIQYISKGSIIQNNGKYFNYLLRAKYYSNDYFCYIYNKIDVSNNSLVYSYHLSYLKTEQVHNEIYNFYLLSKLYITTSNEYRLNLYVCKVEQLKDNIIDILKVDNNIDDSLLNIYLCDNESNFLNNYIINQFIEYNKNVDRTTNEIIIDIDDTFTEKTFTCDLTKGNNKSIINTYKNGYNLNINTDILDKINIECNSDFYYDLLSYYDKTYYKKDNNSLAKHILCKIYEELINNYSEQYKYSNDESHNYLYIPLDKEIKYFCNDSDKLKIYFSNDIYVDYVSLNSSNKYLYINNQTNNIIFDTTQEENKTKIFRFDVDYNKDPKYKDIINNIYVELIYTLPYINAANNWQINDSDSNISAIGKSAGNPNIAILYYDNSSINNNIPICLTNNIHNDIIFNDWTDEQFNADGKQINIKMPKVNKDNIEYLEDIIIFAFTNNHYSSIWILDKENSCMKYIIDPTQNSDKIALKLSIFDKIINDSNYELFTSNNSVILNTYDNELGQIDKTNYYATIRNKNSQEYQNYSNPLNLYFEYNKNIKKINGQYLSYKNTNDHTHYIENLDNINTTSTLYQKPNYRIVSEVMTASDVKTLTQSINKHLYMQNIYIDGQQLNSIEEIRSWIEEQEVAQEIEQKLYPIEYTIIDENNTSSWEEYIPNAIVPTLDLSEILIRNNNVINRVNILGFTSEGDKIYNGYIGTSFEDSNKAILHIGSTTTNINVGTNTLFSPTSITKFSKFNALSLDFDTIKLNAENIETTSPIKNFINYNNTQISYHTFPLISNNIDHIKISYSEEDDYIQYNLLILNLNKIIKTYLNIDINEDNYNIYTNCGIIRPDNNATYYQYYLLINDNLYNNYSIIQDDDNNPDNTIMFSNIIFNVSYYIKDDKNYMNIIINNSSNDNDINLTSNFKFAQNTQGFNNYFGNNTDNPISNEINETINNKFVKCIGSLDDFGTTYSFVVDKNDEDKISSTIINRCIVRCDKPNTEIYEETISDEALANAIDFNDDNINP